MGSIGGFVPGRRVKACLGHIQAHHLFGHIQRECTGRDGGELAPDAEKASGSNDHLHKACILHVSGDELDPAQQLILVVPDLSACEFGEALLRAEEFWTG